MSTIAKYEHWLSEEGLLSIGGWARDGLTDEQIAHNIGVSRSTLNDWKKKYPDISDTLKRGKEVVDRQVENALLKKALGYEQVEIIRERIADAGQKKRHEGIQELTEHEWQICLAYFEHECAYCSKDTELTKDHLDSLKNDGALVFSNVVPACKHCNSSKKDKHWLAWYQKQKYYDTKMAQKIVDYITFAHLFPKESVSNELITTKEVTKHYPPDTTAAIFWLKNRKPNDWRDRKDITHDGEINATVVFANEEDIQE